jgi:hypothetical protein
MFSGPQPLTPADVGTAHAERVHVHGGAAEADERLIGTRAIPPRQPVVVQHGVPEPDRAQRELAHAERHHDAEAERDRGAQDRRRHGALYTLSALASRGSSD